MYIVSNTGHPPMTHHFFELCRGGYVVSYINKNHLKWLKLSIHVQNVRAVRAPRPSKTQPGLGKSYVPFWPGQ